MTSVTDRDVQLLRDALGQLRDREQVAERLLESSAKHSFNPDKELDWEAPVEEGKWFWPPELLSLYDTPLWHKMSEEQRLELARPRPERPYFVAKFSHAYPGYQARH
ncbi:diiron oxygenase, partial [Streptomyces sp. NPDC006283]|uniref:diiron oxygenase n=1 Tax=Streptomyces sp. NPDC006283 TaxID=3156741 RepID=UPI0033B90E75